MSQDSRVDCKGRLGVITNIFSLAKSIGIDTQTKAKKRKSARTLCKDINAKYDQIEWQVAGAVGEPFFDNKSQNWLVPMRWQYFEAISNARTTQVMEEVERIIGQPYWDKRGIKMIKVKWFGFNTVTDEPLDVMKTVYNVQIDDVAGKSGATIDQEDDDNEASKSASGADDDNEASESASSADKDNEASKSASGADKDNEAGASGAKRDQEAGGKTALPQNGRKKTCRATKADRTWSADSERRQTAAPGFAAVDVAGLRLPSDQISAAENQMGDWWLDNALGDLRKLNYIDNPGKGDCMYFALAPMIRLLKPSLFRDMPKSDNGSADTAAAASEDMVQLRRLIAAHVPSSTDYNGAEEYQNIVTKMNLHQPEGGETYQRAYGIPKKATTAAEMAAAVDTKRPKLQQRMMRPSHYGTFADLELLQKVVGPDLIFVVLESQVQHDAPFVCYLIPELAQAAYDDRELVYIFLVHDGAQEHFVRLELKNGQFALRWAELKQQLPQLASILEANCFGKQSDLPLMVSRMVDDYFAQYPELADLSIAELTADGKEVKNKYAIIVESMLGIQGRVRGVGVDANEQLAQKEPDLARYTSLTDSQKMALRNRLAPPQTVWDFIEDVEDEDYAEDDADDNDSDNEDGDDDDSEEDDEFEEDMAASDNDDNDA